jgi:acyl-CoA synthetase (AMP-forming)/AMP-acid ligase II
LPNEYFLYSGDWYRDVGGIVSLRSEGERMLTPLPVFHMNAMAVSVMAMVSVGGCLIMLDRFHPRSWWDQVRESRATCLHYLGVMPSMLMSAPASERGRRQAVAWSIRGALRLSAD